MGSWQEELQKVYTAIVVAVGKWMLEQGKPEVVVAFPGGTGTADMIRKAHAAGIPIGICGQGPGNHPDFAEFLVREGIDSVSLNPDSFLRTVRRIAETEQGIGHEPARERRRTMES
jgi:hypothetical protein